MYKQIEVKTDIGNLTVAVTGLDHAHVSTDSGSSVIVRDKEYSARVDLFLIDGNWQLKDSRDGGYVNALEPFLRNAAGLRIPRELQREIVAVTSPAPSVLVTRKMIREWWVEHWEELGLPKPGPHGKGRIHRQVEEAYWRHHGTNGTGPGGDESISGETGDENI